MRRDVFISIALILILGGLNFADQHALFPNYSLIEKEFSVTHKDVGVLGSIYILSVGISMVIYGILSDKYSRKKLILSGALIWSICAYLTYIVKSFDHLMIVRAMDGIGIGSFFPIVYAMVSDYFPPTERGSIYACLLYTSPSPRDLSTSRMPSSA